MSTEIPEWGPDTPGPKPDLPKEQKAPKERRPHAFRGGFFGCLGVGVAVMAVIVVLAVAIGSSVKSDLNSGKPTLTNGPTAATPDQPVDTTTVSAIYSVPEAKDFKLTVKLTSRQCFGSAGCNVEYKVTVGWGSTYDPDKSYSVTVKISGFDDGAQIETMDVSGDKYDPIEGFGSVTSSGMELHASVIDIEEN